MSRRSAAASLAALLACASPASTLADTPGQKLEIDRAGSQPSSNGSPNNFTGDVVIQPLFAASAHRHAAAASVSFAPRARTAWHSHPAGQTLVVTSGTGWVQAWGGSRAEVRAGDVIWTPPDVKHWHGATASDAMTHIAIQEHVGGKVVEWLEPVSDAQYRQ